MARPYLKKRRKALKKRRREDKGRREEKGKKEEGKEAIGLMNRYFTCKQASSILQKWQCIRSCYQDLRQRFTIYRRLDSNYFRKAGQRTPSEPFGSAAITQMHLYQATWRAGKVAQHSLVLS